MSMLQNLEPLDARLGECLLSLAVPPQLYEIQAAKNKVKMKRADVVKQPRNEDAEEVERENLRREYGDPAQARHSETRSARIGATLHQFIWARSPPFAMLVSAVKMQGGRSRLRFDHFVIVWGEVWGLSRIGSIVCTRS
jgi:hypothetical protein